LFLLDRITVMTGNAAMRPVVTDVAWSVCV